MTRSDAELASDISDAARRLEQIARRGRWLFTRSRTLREAAERNIGIAGEAANDISDGFKAAHPDLKELCDRVYKARNQLAHAYEIITPAYVWETMKTAVPELAAGLNREFPLALSRERLLRSVKAHRQRPPAGRRLCGATTAGGGVCAQTAPRLRRKCAAGHPR